MRFFLFVLTFICLSSAFAQNKINSVIRTEQVEISLVSAQSSYIKNSQFHLGLLFKLKPEWHVYWQNAGDSGSAPKWTWTVENGSVDLAGWPVPERIPVEHLINFGYNHEVLIPFNAMTGGEGDFVATVDLEWLVCKVECIPGFGKLQIRVPQSDVMKVSVPAAKMINSYLQKIPVAAPFKLKAGSVENDQQKIILDSSEQFKEIHFFPHTLDFYTTQSPQVESLKKGYELTVALNINRASDPVGEKATVIVVHADGKESYYQTEIINEASAQSLLWVLLLALVGGAILNLMPCVFPVLSIKILSFMGKEKDYQALKVSGWLYSLGVVLSFAALAVILLLLRMAGEQLGWGFQLQSPWFVGFLIVLFILIGLNLLGVFEVGHFLTRIGFSQNTKSSPKLSAFMSGVLATVVATPCTAPFMGTAIGFTLTQAYSISILVFVTLGIGMALPFLLLCYFPRTLMRYLKPGAWMETLKKALAIPMFLTVLWLSWVLYQQLGAAHPAANKNWANFDKAVITESLKQQDAVFIDFTAAWCITCQVNKKAVLETEEIQKLFADNAVKLFRADWTSYDPLITKELESFGRNSLPVYVFYKKGSAEPVLLPEILTKQMIRDLFEQPTDLKNKESQ